MITEYEYKEFLHDMYKQYLKSNNPIFTLQNVGIGTINRTKLEAIILYWHKKKDINILSTDVNNYRYELTDKGKETAKNIFN